MADTAWRIRMVIENNKQNERQRWVSSQFPVAPKKTPRPYQLAVFQELTTRLNDHKRALAHLATGAGKTYITMEWLRRQNTSEATVLQKKTTMGWFQGQTMFEIIF